MAARTKFLALLLVATFAYAQQQPYIETFEVRLHNLDVIVTDAAGKAVHGLTKDDFVILEEGAPQEITNFAEYSESEGRAVRASGAPTPEGAPEARTTPPRKFIFFIDDMTLHPQTRKKMMKNATALLEKSMGPGDEAAVIRPVGEENVVQTFTGDIDAVVNALQSALDSTAIRVDTQGQNELRNLELQLVDSSSKQERQFIRRMYAENTRRRVEQRLGQIRALVGSFAGTEGKKILVLVGTSLPAEPGREVADPDDRAVGVATVNEVPTTMQSFFDLRPQIADLANSAAANGVVIYTLQADAPMEYVVPFREAPRPRIRPQTAGVIVPNQPAVMPGNIYQTLITGTETTMTSLAEKTGGRAFRGDSNVDDIFNQVGTDLRSYYSLAYHAKGDTERTRRVEVRVKDRPELRVRTRTGVLEKSPAREMEEHVIANLVYPRGANELAIRAVPGTMTKARNVVTIPVETQIPLERLTFLIGQDGKYHASFSVHYAVAGEKADFAAGQSRLQEIVVTQEELAAIPGKLFRFTSNLAVAPGHVKIAVGVLDQTSKLSGFSTIRMWAK
jgi:VWFA-related protein